MKTVAIVSTWNNALWIESCLAWALPFFDRIIVQEANWTSDDRRWAADTSPDGTAAMIRAFPDPAGKIEFYQLGRWPHGCLAARAELCSRIPPCDWVYVLDVDEFQSDGFITFLGENLQRLQRKGYMTISQHSRSFYWDLHRHTVEGFTRLFRWYPGFNAWSAQYTRPADFNVPRELGPLVPDAAAMGPEIYHFSYVPPDGVEIKGAQSFDVSLERYQEWYKNDYRKFDGTNLEAVYAGNGGGVHVFRGMPVTEYQGAFPSILDTHPLRHATWYGDRYEDREGNPIALKGWWNA